MLAEHHDVGLHELTSDPELARKSMRYQSRASQLFGSGFGKPHPVELDRIDQPDNQATPPLQLADQPR